MEELYAATNPENLGLIPESVIRRQETAAWLAQLGEHRSVEREVAGSSPGRTNTQGLNNYWEESAAFVMTSANG